MREGIEQYRKRVADLQEHAKGNEQATKQSLIGPLFTLLGYDLTDPRECMPEFRADFGPGRSNKPVDWAFQRDGRPIFFVEAKECGKKLPAFDEQLSDYFAKVPEANLGISTNGIAWRFFTDIINQNVMDKEPFLEWNVLDDREPPYEFLTLLQKTQYRSDLIRAYATKLRQTNLLIGELSRLLEPSAEFIRLAVANLEVRKMTESVLEQWRPQLVSAIHEWAKQRVITSVVAQQARLDDVKASVVNPAKNPDSRIETTQEELDAFAAVQRALGSGRPVQYQDTINYFKIHLPERQNQAVCRVQFGRKRMVWFPLESDTIVRLAPGVTLGGSQSMMRGWTSLEISSPAELATLSSLLIAAYDEVKSGKVKESQVADDGSSAAVQSEVQN
jgi:hypothetical protein